MKNIFLIFSLIAAINVFSQKITMKYPPKLYYYDFSSKTLYADGDFSKNDTAFRPIKYRSGNDLQIKINNFNPLKDEISVNDSSLIRFASDADIAKFSAFVILPKISDLTDTTKTAGSVAGVNGSNQKGNSPAKQPKQENSCEKIKTLMVDFNTEKETVLAQIKAYKLYLTKVEFINDDYTYLKSLNALTPTAVTDRLTNSFIFELTKYIQNLGGTVKQIITPADVSGRQLSVIEETLYDNIANAEKAVEAINKEVNDIKTDNCKEYIDLYKQFIQSYNDLKSGLTSLDDDRTGKILPEFKKATSLFELLKIYLTEAPFTVTYATTIEKDKHTIIIKNKAVASTSTPVVYDYINIEPVRGWKLDIAGGFFISGLADHEYSLHSKDSIYTKKYLVNGSQRDTTVQESFTAVYKEKQSSMSFGGMIYLHAHSQNSGFFNYGVSLGFGALFNDQTRWAGSFGPTFLIGKTQRFNINPAVFLSQVKRLSPPYETDKWYSETINNVPTYMAWKLSWGVGFSWNIK